MAKRPLNEPIETCLRFAVPGNYRYLEWIISTHATAKVRPAFLGLFNCYIQLFKFCSGTQRYSVQSFLKGESMIKGKYRGLSSNATILRHLTLCFGNGSWVVRVKLCASPLFRKWQANPFPDFSYDYSKVEWFDEYSSFAKLWRWEKNDLIIFHSDCRIEWWRMSFGKTGFIVKTGKPARREEFLPEME